ncbi:MAG: alpha/beta hydrolase [Actinobacteria bacterium]|nr:alpha/beta hydrolase [Actinomycetota bacterium]
MKYVESFDGTRIAYERWGSGPSIVLLPGINFSLEVWDRIVTDLAPTFDVVGVDLRGHGSSDKPATGYDYGSHARDVGAVVDALQLERFTLVGWSLGAAIALRYASESQKPSRLLLAGPAAPKFTSSPNFDAGLPEDAVRGLMERERTERPDYRRWVIEQSLHRDTSDVVLDWLWSLSMKTPSWSSLACLEALIQEDLREVLGQIDVPTCVVRGANDGFVPAGATSALAEMLPNCTTVEFEDSGHMPFFEEPERFVELVRRFTSEMTDR